jgi:hypothetical protein
MTGRHYDTVIMDDIVKDGSKTATGVAALAQTYYEKAMIQNLKANTAFGRWNWICACGKEATKTEGLPDNSIPLCDGCFFRATVMKAAGRFREFCDAQEELRAKQWAEDDSTNAPIDILKHATSGYRGAMRRPLPARSGKTIQMYNYLGKPRKK